jgi:hypothetical protein
VKLRKYRATSEEDIPDQQVIEGFVLRYYDPRIHQAPLRHVLSWYLHDPETGMGATGYSETEFERVYAQVYQTIHNPVVRPHPEDASEAG